jgi:glycosyltransferase involved in cell wall biosynthesis
MGYNATVVITTKNRKDDLRRALKSAVAQVPPVEVIVMDDGATDGTKEMILSEFPSVRVVRSEQSLGLIVQRNRAAQLAASRVIFSIDDDAEFSSSQVVAQTLAEFNHYRVGAVAIPFADVYRKLEYGTKLPNPDNIYVDHIYIGTAHAVRVDLFMRLGGYREVLYHQGEEDDFCARLLEAGYVVRCGRADLIYHYVSPKRDLKKIAYFGARNAVLFAWANVPMPNFIIHLVGTSVINLINGIQNKHLFATLKGLMRGYFDCANSHVKRKAISTQTYRLFRILRKDGPKQLKDIEQLLNAPLFEKVL